MQTALDPHELRYRAFAALRDLLTRLGDRHRLVIVIDDLHWSDADSLSLLAHLLRPPDPPQLLLVVTARTGDVVASLPGDVRSLHVDRLAMEDARELAARLLGRNSGSTGAADVIAEEAAGHPMFIDVLVRHAALSPGDEPRAPRLDDALRAHVARLDAAARRLLGIVCLVGAPLTQDASAHASHLDAAELSRALAMLRVASLVRTTGPRLSDAVEPFHDRVREAVVPSIEPAVRRDLHRRIASTLELSRAGDHEVLAVHWRGAGDAKRACEHLIEAAEEAVRALAFNRAARLYASALELLPAEDAARRSQVRKARGDALANSGEGILAAEEYERAAEGATGAEALDLRRRAAEQLLRCGVAERGLAALGAVLAAVGMRVPDTFLGAIVQLLLYRFVIRLRGLGFRAKDEREVPASELTRIDICWSASLALSYIDTFKGAVFQARHLLLALRAGERSRIARALGAEAGYIALGGRRAWRRTESVIARGHQVADSLGTPYARATVLVGAGVAHALNSRFLQAVEMLDTAVEISPRPLPRLRVGDDHRALLRVLCARVRGAVPRAPRRRVRARGGPRPGRRVRRAHAPHRRPQCRLARRGRSERRSAPHPRGRRVVAPPELRAHSHPRAHGRVPRRPLRGGARGRVRAPARGVEEHPALAAHVYRRDQRRGRPHARAVRARPRRGD